MGGDGRRSRVEPTDEREQLALLCRWLEQLAYEKIRPLTLFGASVSERAHQTGSAERTLYRRVGRFEEEGMESRETARRRRLPPAMRRLVVDLKAEYPGFNPNEIANSVYVRFGRRPDRKTVRRVLEEEPIPLRFVRRFPPYREIPDPRERRLAVVTLHAEGWSSKAIAGYLRAHKSTIHCALKRWAEEGPEGLEDRRPGRPPGVRKVTLRAMEAVRRLQQNPNLGEFRVHAALAQIGIHLSPRTCGRILSLNRELYGLDKPKGPVKEKREMPFAARRRHQYWTVDVRYLKGHGLGCRTYVISVLDNHSRAVLSSALTRTQDLASYLSVLYAAVERYGSSEALVTDGGGIFRARQARAVYGALGIAKHEIERGRPWQSYIETHFNIQRRMADWHFAKAESWAELAEAHERFVEDYNAQDHWAHREREDGRRSPSEVLGFVSGVRHREEELGRAFFSSRFVRVLDSLGYARFRHWRLFRLCGGCLCQPRLAGIMLVRETRQGEGNMEPDAASDVPQWHVAGDWFDVCRCDIPCPCEFAQAPTDNWCQGVLAYHVREGNYGDVRLDSLSLIGLAAFEGNVWAGEGEISLGLFIDERADERQREALQMIFGGQAGGFQAELAELIGEMRGVEFVPIEFEVADDLAFWRAEIPGRVVATAEALTGPTTPEGQRVQLLNPPGSEVGPGQVATWGTAITDRAEGFGFEWEWDGKSSKHIPFDWSGP